MRRNPKHLLVSLLVLFVACETPEQSDSSGTSGETPSRDERTVDKTGTSLESGGEPFSFDSLSASSSGEREALLYATPDDPRALLWVFHGRGDSREICRRDHLKRALRVFYRAGFAVVCPQTLDRRAEAWEGGTMDGAGADIENVRRARKELRSRGIVSADLPDFGWGISNGGGFVGKWAYHELSNGADIRGIHCMIARCRSAARAGGEFGLHVHWAAAKNDPFFSFDGVRNTYRAYDGAKSLTVAEPAPLTVSKLQSLAGLSRSDAQRVRRILKEEGLLDDGGVPSCDPKSSAACMERLADAHDSADVDASQSAVRHAYENCRASHMAFHMTCDGDDNTATVLEAFQDQL